MDSKPEEEAPTRKRHRGGVCLACGTSLAGDYGTSGRCTACVGEVICLRAPGTPQQAEYRVVWRGAVTTPAWRERGPAAAYLSSLERGVHEAEYHGKENGMTPRPIPGFKLVGKDGNSFAIMGRFQHAARRLDSEGKPFVSKEDVTAVMVDAQSGDYDHLLQVFIPWDGDGEEADDE